ncbi:hypothetical protein FQA39_LY11550 [Lamprigera yunnana]|nr:hypothetical protein FQA39_LY11550 [Lamprigera yunnana]
MYVLENHRPISLLNVTYKVLANLIKTRLQEVNEMKIDENHDEDANEYDLVVLKSELSESCQSIESDSLAISEERSKRRRRSGSSNECTDSFVQKLLASKSMESTQDMWHKFGSFVESSLRNMKNEKNRVKCKHEILQIIIKFEEEETL